MTPRTAAARVSLAAGLTSLVVLAGALTAARSARTAGDPVIAAAGDIACDPLDRPYNDGNGTSRACRQMDTAAILGSTAPAAVLPLGDDQYECGGYAAFEQVYAPSWGQFASITHPVPGNHEYQASGGTDCDGSGTAAGYFQYFGASAADPAEGYYSYDIGTWHLIALNSNCPEVGGCSAGSPEEQWLRADLAAHPAQCTLAYFHYPRFSSSGDVQGSSAFWADLYAAGADVVLSAHKHNYERFAPQDANGAADPSRGIREFVVGTGGKSHQGFKSTPAPNSEVRDAATFGVLELTLHPGSYSWQFLPAGGKTFADSGSTSCH